jgi:hypothetical protein
MSDSLIRRSISGSAQPVGRVERGDPITRLSAIGLSKSRSVAALAFHHLVALLEQALAFAILALGLLLDVRAFFIGHVGSPRSALSAGLRPKHAR